MTTCNHLRRIDPSQPMLYCPGNTTSALLARLLLPNLSLSQPNGGRQSRLYHAGRGEASVSSVLSLPLSLHSHSPFHFLFSFFSVPSHSLPIPLTFPFLSSFPQIQLRIGERCILYNFPQRGLGLSPSRNAEIEFRALYR